MSFLKTPAFAAMKSDLKARSDASRARHARDLAAVEIAEASDAAGTITMTPAEFSFSMLSGVDPVEVRADEHEDDH